MDALNLIVVWNFDHTTELVGVILGGIAAITGTAAALYSRAGNRASSRNWAATIRPGITLLVAPRPVYEPNISMRISNTGGAVRPGFLAIADGWGVCAGRYHVPEHTAGQELRLPIVWKFNEQRDTLAILLHIARDVSESWWDAARGVPFGEDVPDPRDPENAFDNWCSDWWHRELERLPGHAGIDLSPGR